MTDIFSRALQRVASSLDNVPDTAPNPGAVPYQTPTWFGDPTQPQQSQTPTQDPWSILSAGTGYSNAVDQAWNASQGQSIYGAGTNPDVFHNYWNGLLSNSRSLIDGKIKAVAAAKQQAAQQYAPPAFGANRPGGVDTGGPSVTTPFNTTNQALAQWTPRINQAATNTGVPALAYAASILNESGGDPNAVNHLGATGLFQALPLVGRGGRYSIDQLKDPELQFQLAEPEFKDAYSRAVSQGWQGPEQIGATIAYAQRYERALDANGRYDPNSDTNRQVMSHIMNLWNQGHDQQLRTGPYQGVSQNDLGLPLQCCRSLLRPNRRDLVRPPLWRNPTVQEAMDLGKQLGWTQRQGMAGPGSEVKLLQQMGVQAQMVPVNWDQIGQTVSQGCPGDPQYPRALLPGDGLRRPHGAVPVWGRGR
jgi:hypothetical protein